MVAPDLVIRSTRVVAGTGAPAPASIHVAGGRIVAIAGYADVPAGCPIDDAGDAVVSPGLVDTHVHVNEPGRAAWEGFAAATRAAAAGGVTTIVDMPLNSIPPTTTADALASKRAAAAGQCWVDVGLWGGVVPGNLDDLEPLARGGVLGYKCFLVPSGVDEFPHVGDADLRPALARLRDLGRPLLVHAEHPDAIAAAAGALRGDARRYATYLASRPPEAEDRAVDLMIRLARDTGAAVHIVHHASAGSLDALSRARDDGLAVTAETCPHYLRFCAEAIPDGATAFKCAPPIREAHHRERLWEALAAGVLDMVVTDHSPCTPDLKRRGSGSFADAWGGIASLQLGLAVTWTEARRRGFGVERLAQWLSVAPARLAGLSARKGRIAVGCDADLVVWDPDVAWTVDATRLHHRNPVTPYDGDTLHGAVRTTYLRGVAIYRDGRHCGKPAGQLLAAS